ncbi:MAG: trimethylamine methyltransferase family protein [Anaerolineaceae bacterium]|nr:trimethylamine methyltransferase family protein [Anaerolineaceae bacterium]
MTVKESVPDMSQNLQLRIRPKLNMLDHEDCLKLHQASCEILRKTGIDVHNAAGLDLLKKAGAVVEDMHVRIPPSLVEWALASAPDKFNLYQRGTDKVAMRLDGEQVYFGPGSDTLRYLDPRSGVRRDFMLKDVADSIVVCDALKEIGFVMSVGVPRDMPTDTYYQHQFATMLRNTTKPIVVVCNGLVDIEAIYRMAAAAAGGEDLLLKYPTLLMYSEPSTPLKHSDTAVDKLLFCAEHAIPITHSPAPMMGGTAPVTLAGAVVLGNAEMLSGLVMHQLKNPGAPFLYGHGVHHLDMKTMISVYGAPEYQLARVMAAEMGRFYRLPVWGYAGHSDSKVLDGQAAADTQFSVLIALMAKTNVNHDVGYLESGLTHSPELMVVADEIISESRSFMDGVRLDDDALALDVIDQVGVGGSFTSNEHTMRNWRELWRPQLFDRKRLDRWEEQGSKDLNMRTREKTVALMNDHKVEPLPDSVEKEIEKILAH